MEIHVRMAGCASRNTDGAILMSMAIAENFIRNAREQHSQQDINASLIKALGEIFSSISAGSPK